MSQTFLEDVKMPKVYVENMDQSVASMFAAEGFINVSDIRCADLVCLVGGGDVDPSLYGEGNTKSFSKIESDMKSLGIIAVANLLGTPIIGICRGGQILNVSLGGKMIQHLPNHNHSFHPVVVDGEKIPMTSSHHQGMLPNMDLDPIVHQSEDGVNEVVIYSNNAICFQPHPEYVNRDHPCWGYFFSLVYEMLGVSQ